MAIVKENFLLKRILIGGFGTLTFIASHAQSAQKQMPWKAAIQSQRGYGMAEVCMGMTLRELMELPGTRVMLWTSNQWARNCEGSYAEWEHADFIARDGTRFGIGFRDFPGQEQRDDRFRVQSVALSMPVELEDFIQINATLVNRYHMASPPGHGFESEQEDWSVDGGGFTLRLNSRHREIPGISLLSMSIASEEYPVWLSTQPACAKPTKRLPKI